MPTSSQEMPSWLRSAFALPDRVYALGAGRLLGHRFVRLTHTGRRSGRQFHVVVEVARYDRRSGEAVVVSGFGRRADWYRNLVAGGPAYVDFGHGPRRADHRELDTEEALAVFAHYERHNRLLMPLFRPALSALLGWRYDGSEGARRRLVEAMPMLALRPAP